MDIADKLKAYFQPAKDVSFAFLFGSYARGRTLKESDIDIAVYLKEGYSFNRVKEIWRDVEDLARKDVDLVILNTASPLIGYTAIRGKPLALNDYEAYLSYMLQISQEAEDFRYFLLDMWGLKEKLKTEGLHMNPLNEIQKASIVKRIDFIELELTDLEQYEGLTFETYSQDRRTRRDIERISENVANAVIDICKIVLVGEDTELPETYREIFNKLSQMGIVRSGLGESLSDLTRLRNVLAHQYLDIKWEMIKDFMVKGKNDVKTFLTTIKTLVEKS